MNRTPNHSTPFVEPPEHEVLPPAPSTPLGRHLRAVTTVTLLALLALLAVASCSKNGYSPPTAPGGGNGGGGGPLNFGPFATGQSASFTFASAGTFGYHCIPHRAMGMVGEVLVDDAGADSALVQIGAGGFSFAPGTAHIKPGGHVRWVNASNLTNHTVTSN